MCWSSYTIQFGKAVDKQFASLYRTQSSYITPVIVKDEVPQKTDAFCCVYTTKLNSCVEKWILFAEIVAFAHSVSIFRPLSTVADDKVFLRKHQTRRPNAKESPHILATANCNCLKWQPFFHKLNDNFSLRTKTNDTAQCSWYYKATKLSCIYFDLLICILGIIFLLSLLFHGSCCFREAVCSDFMLLQEFALLKLKTGNVRKRRMKTERNEKKRPVRWEWTLEITTINLWLPFYMLRVGLGWILIKKWCSDGHTTNTVFIWTL